MFSFFRPKDRWKWDSSKGVPTKKVLKLQRQALRSGRSEEKKRVLEHIADVAEKGTELQSAFCDGKVTADVCRCFLADVPMVQEAAADALAALCHLHPANCAAVIAAHPAPLHPNTPTRHPAAPAPAGGGGQQPVPHALTLIKSAEQATDLAIAAAGFLDSLAATSPASVTQLLLQPGGTSGLLGIVRAASSASLSPTTSPARTTQLLELLSVLLGLLLTAAAGGGPAMCRELGKAHGLGLLLELVGSHRGQAPLAVSAGGGGAGGGAGEGGDGACEGHAAVVRDALSLLEIITSTVPAHRLPLLDGDGVTRLLGALRDLSLPWSARLHAVAALRAAAASPSVAAELARVRALEQVLPMLDAFVSGRQVAGAPGTFSSPPRGGAPPASPSRANGPSSSPVPPTPGACAATSAAAADDEEPNNPVVVEALLGLVDSIASNADAARSLLTGPRVRSIMSAFNAGMGSFRSGGYRMAAAAAQLLFRLAQQQQPGGEGGAAGGCGSGQQQPLASSPLSGQDVCGPLTALVERAVDYAGAGDAKQAQVLHGAWCAAGLLVKVMEDGLHPDRRDRADRVREVLSGPRLRGAVKLLDASAPALLAAVGAAPAPGTAAAAAAASATGLHTPGPVGGEELSPAGLAFLSSERVLSDLRSSCSALLSLLVELAGEVAHRPAMQQMEAAEAVQKLLPWRHTQWHAKRLLHLLGVMEAEYQPFVRFGCGHLLAALLAGQGVDPAPFLARRVDADLLLGMDDACLRSLGLDEVAVRKVNRIAAAHAMFNQMDSADGRIDGCVSAADCVTFLTNSANMRPEAARDLQERLFRELQVLPGEPICFMQFVHCYPWLDGEVGLFIRTAARQGSGTGAAEASADGYGVPSAKRQRVGAGGGGSVSTPQRAGRAGAGAFALQ